MSSKTASKSTKEPQTMAELLAQSSFKVRGFSSGDKVKAKVVAKNPKSLILDIGGKSEGMVAEKAFIESKDFIKTLNIGDEVMATVIVGENREGNVLLSLRHSAHEATWDVLKEAKNSKNPIGVVGKAVNPSGITVEVEGVIGFIPGSQLGRDTAKNSEELVGKHFKAVVIEVEKESNKVVLSEKEVSEAKEIKLAKDAVKKIKEGEIYDAIVTTITNFGCFVKLIIDGKPSDIEGLVHISEISWDKVATVADVLKEGEKVKVKALAARDGKLSLSIKQVLSDPWETVDEDYKVEDKFEGRVVKVSDFGVFVQIKPGLEGLIHITKIPPTFKLRSGDSVNCYIEEIDAKNKKISLGMVLKVKPVGYK